MKGADRYPGIRGKEYRVSSGHFYLFSDQTVRTFSILLVISRYRSADSPGSLFADTITGYDGNQERTFFLMTGTTDAQVSIAATTTIRISGDTKELLWKTGAKGRSYDALIRGLPSDANGKVLDKRWNTISDEDEFIPLDALPPG